MRKRAESFLPGDIERRRVPVGKGLGRLHVNQRIDSLPANVRKDLEGYNLTMVGDDTVASAAVARWVMEGLDKYNLCDIAAGLCEKSKGIPRDLMPQIEGVWTTAELAAGDADAQDKLQKIVDAGGEPDSDVTVLEMFLAHLEDLGVKMTRMKVPVGMLLATQRELWADKVYGIADSYLTGDLPSVHDDIIVSSDGYILDGHHRWAALMVLSPHREIGVIRVGRPIHQLLLEAVEFPGVTVGT